MLKSSAIETHLSAYEKQMPRLFEGTPWDIPPTCDRCEKRVEDCDCPPLVANSPPPEKQTARIYVERRKKGKIATVIRGLQHSEEELKSLLKTLKDFLGSGGTIKEENLEIQGDHAVRMEQKLAEIGYKTKRI